MSVVHGKHLSPAPFLFTSNLKIFVLHTSRISCELEMCTPPPLNYTKNLCLDLENLNINVIIKNWCMTLVPIKENVQIWLVSVV